MRESGAQSAMQSARLRCIRNESAEYERIGREANAGLESSWTHRCRAAGKGEDTMTMFTVGLAAIAGLSIFIVAACGSDVPGPARGVDDGVVRKFDIWPELHYDGTLSTECREQIIDKTTRDKEGFRRYVGTEVDSQLDREVLSFILSAPFRSHSQRLYGEIRSVIGRLEEEFEEEVGYPIEWNSEEERYYLTLPDGARTDSTPKIPCAQDRERIERFNRVRWDWGTSERLEKALDGFWRTCIPWPDPGDERAIRTCDEYRLLYGWWLPELPDDAPIQRRPDG